MKSYRMMWWTVTTVLLVIGSTVAVLFAVPAGPILASVLAGAVGFVVAPFVAVRGRHSGWLTRLGGTVYGCLIGAALTGMAVLLGSGAASLMVVLVVAILAIPLVPGWLMQRLTAELLPERRAGNAMRRRHTRRTAPSSRPAAGDGRLDSTGEVGELGEVAEVGNTGPGAQEALGAHGAQGAQGAPALASGGQALSVDAPAQPIQDDPAGLTDDQLCRAWRTSFTALQRRPDATQRDVLTTARTGYLNELERRDPAGFARWIAAGARAASNPGRYRTKAPRPAIQRPGAAAPLSLLKEGPTSPEAA